jgi:osmoprotectant transport system permease protein
MALGDARPRRGPPCNAPLLLLACLLAASLLGLPWLSSAPHRLVSGAPIHFSAFPPGDLIAVGVLLALPMVMALSTGPGSRLAHIVSLLAACALPGALLWVVGRHAAALAPTLPAIARIALGGGFWLALLLAGLMAAQVLQQLRAGWLLRAAAAAVVLGGVAVLLGAGQGDALSIVREGTSRAGELRVQALRHLQIVGISLLIALAIGLPAGWLASQSRRVAGPLFPALGIVQTIPSIALFGLLMAPLALLAARWPGLAALGISGVGLAPGVIALVLYSLLPVVRGMVSGLAQVPPAALEAARGMGMRPGQMFRQVQWPLAAPVVLAGVRTAAVQAVGLAAVTALIGAGGLGAILFEGLFASAQDLVLLGVLPIVLLGVAVDLCFKAWGAASARRARGGRFE